LVSQNSGLSAVGLENRHNPFMYDPVRRTGMQAIENQIAI